MQAEASRGSVACMGSLHGCGPLSGMDQGSGLNVPDASEVASNVTQESNCPLASHMPPIDATVTFCGSAFGELDLYQGVVEVTSTVSVTHERESAAPGPEKPARILHTSLPSLTAGTPWSRDVKGLSAGHMLSPEGRTREWGQRSRLSPQRASSRYLEQHGPIATTPPHKSFLSPSGHVSVSNNFIEVNILSFRHVISVKN